MNLLLLLLFFSFIMIKRHTMENIGTIIVFTIILIIVIWIILKFTSFYGNKQVGVKNYATLVKNKIGGSVSNTISGNTIPTSRFSNEYALSFWIHVNDYTYRYGKEKTIMIRGKDESTSNPKITLADKSNTLIVKIALQTQDPNSYVVPSASQAPSASPTPSATTSGSEPFMASGTEQRMAGSEPFMAVSGNEAPLEAALYNAEFFKSISGNKLAGKGYLDYLTVEDAGYMTVKPPIHTNETYDLTDISGIALESGCIPLVPQKAKESFDNHTSATANIGICNVAELPLQKWVHVVVSVYNNIVDIYIDGQLSSSCVLSGFPMAPTADLNISPEGGFSGSLANVVAVNSALSPKDVKDLYNDGPEYAAGFWGTIKSYFSSANILNS
jgi:hypothetical protein